MLPFLLFAVIWTICQSDPMSESYSYSPAVGLGTGTPYSSETDGCITAIRVWERVNAYIAGFQLRYGQTWSSVFGVKVGEPQEMELCHGETIVQVSGKYNPANYIYMMMFVTSKGRSLTAGQPYQASFNFYASEPDTELKILSGRCNEKGITSVGAHWGGVNKEYEEYYTEASPVPMKHESLPEKYEPLPEKYEPLPEKYEPHDDHE